MSKAVLISIRPKWSEKIVLGEKTIEVRKTRPKLETPFKVYIYCTSGRPDLNIPISPEHLMQDYLDTGSMQSLNCPLGNGKVIGEFTCDRIDEYDDDTIFSFRHEDYARWNDFDLYRACMHPEDFQNYANGKWLYGWHISNLKIYDEPKELGEFTAACRYKNDDGTCPPRRIECSFQRYDYNPDGSINIVECGNTIRHPPQSWGYVEELL